MCQNSAGERIVWWREAEKQSEWHDNSTAITWSLFISPLAASSHATPQLNEEGSRRDETRSRLEVWPANFAPDSE